MGRKGNTVKCSEVLLMEKERVWCFVFLHVNRMFHDGGCLQVTIARRFFLNKMYDVILNNIFFGEKALLVGNDVRRHSKL